MSPTEHELAAAIQVARFIDDNGNLQADARNSYLFTATDATFAPATLRAGEALLLSAGLLRLVDGRLMPTPALEGFAAIPDPQTAAASLKAVLAQQATADERAETGAVGEEFVLGEVRANLESLHRPDLAIRCERVSLISDSFGYDIAAPMLTDAVRRLEVKTQSVDSPPATVRFFLTRHEYDVGRSNAGEWALVMCTRSRITAELVLVGWCRASTLLAYLPADHGGKWTEALVQLPVSVLTAGFPSAI